MQAKSINEAEERGAISELVRDGSRFGDGRPTKERVFFWRFTRRRCVRPCRVIVSASSSKLRPTMTVAPNSIRISASTTTRMKSNIACLLHSVKRTEAAEGREQPPRILATELGLVISGEIL